MLRRRCHLKMSYLELLKPLCTVDWNHLCNIGRGHHKEQSCEIILSLDQCFRKKCCINVFPIWNSGSPFVQQSVTICAIFFEGFKRNNSVKLFWIWVSGLGGDVVWNISYLELWWPSCSMERNHLEMLKEGIMGKIHVKLYEIRTSGSGADVV